MVLPTDLYKISSRYIFIIHCFWAFWHRPPPHPVTNHAVFIWCVKCKTTTVCKRISLVTGGGGGGSTSVKVFLFSICWKAKSGFSTLIFKYVLVQWENTFEDNSGVEPTIFLMEKTIVYFETFFLAIFMGNPSLRLSEVLSYGVP